MVGVTSPNRQLIHHQPLKLGPKIWGLTTTEPEQSFIKPSHQPTVLVAESLSLALQQ
jgi:hypothetical protein